jgi:hypothetical protein
MSKIDAVLTWLDGEDPVFKARRAKYLTSRGEDKFDDIAGTARTVQSNEIFYAVASILRFAPYVGRIFIVTPSQDPHLGPFLEKHFPQNDVPVIIVDQETLFREEEKEYIPVFNSLAVETLICRIPTLTEEFIYMNDDYFFASPSSKEDLFRDGKVVCYSPLRSSLSQKILRAVRIRKDGHLRFTYKDSLLNGAEILGVGHFYHLPHEPHPMLRSVLSSYLDAHPDVTARNLRHRFRDNEEFNFQGLFYLLAEKEGRIIREDVGEKQMMFRPRRGKTDYISRKIRRAGKMGGLMFGCMNSFQYLSPSDQVLFRDWIESILGITS